MVAAATAAVLAAVVSIVSGTSTAPPPSAWSSASLKNNSRTSPGTSSPDPEEALIAAIAASRTPSWSPSLAERSATQDSISTSDMIEMERYNAEKHEVRTGDGYLLTMHRIPNPGRPAVYLQHGLLCSSAVWVVLGKGKALAYLLHDAGYDVWLGNFRGNTFSRGHVKYTVHDKLFWMFSWHENGVEDVPAMIDYVLKESKQSKLVYIGHSMGTTAFFVTASMKPQYNDKVVANYALAPVVYLNNMGSLMLRIIAAGAGVSHFVTNALGLYEFNPSSSLLSYVASVVCPNVIAVLQSICTNPVFLLSGFNEDQVDENLIHKLAAILPSGSTSQRTLHHFAQLYQSGRFRQFDYGLVENLMHYGTFSTPEYPLSRVTTPTHLHWAENDILASPKDVQKLHDILPNVVTFRRVPRDSFGHLDFLIGKDATKLLYVELVNSIKRSRRRPKRWDEGEQPAPPAPELAPGSAATPNAENQITTKCCSLADQK